LHTCFPTHKLRTHINIPFFFMLNNIFFYLFRHLNLRLLFTVSLATFCCLYLTILRKVRCVAFFLFLMTFLRMYNRCFDAFCKYINHLHIEIVLLTKLCSQSDRFIIGLGGNVNFPSILQLNLKLK